MQWRALCEPVYTTAPFPASISSHRESFVWTGLKARATANEIKHELKQKLGGEGAAELLPTESDTAGSSFPNVASLSFKAGDFLLHSPSSLCRLSGYRKTSLYVLLCAEQTQVIPHKATYALECRNMLFLVICWKNWYYYAGRPCLSSCSQQEEALTTIHRPIINTWGHNLNLKH